MLPEADIYQYFPPGRIWHKVILMWGAMQKTKPTRGRFKNVCCLFEAPPAPSDKVSSASGQFRTLHNVSQMNPAGLGFIWYITWARHGCLFKAWTRPESLVLCNAFQWRHRPPEIGLARGPFSLKSVFDLESLSKPKGWEAICVVPSYSSSNTVYLISFFSFFSPEQLNPQIYIVIQLQISHWL